MPLGLRTSSELEEICSTLSASECEDCTTEGAAEDNLDHRPGRAVKRDSPEECPPVLEDTVRVGDERIEGGIVV